MSFSARTLPFDVPAHIRWIAQDSSGVWWGYTVEPLRNDTGWYENEVGDYVRLGETEPDDWTSSLQKCFMR
ncbi:MAG: hypothetical protein OEX83_05650 [Gammaproteobacteria bacterium]|nr:hypothetical protein [Gammaproteobacteria bacterium]